FVRRTHRLGTQQLEPGQLTRARDQVIRWTTEQRASEHSENHCTTRGVTDRGSSPNIFACIAREHRLRARAEHRSAVIWGVQALIRWVPIWTASCPPPQMLHAVARCNVRSSAMDAHPV